ncbi:MAG: hypothetical protein ABI273_05210, partial [Lacunisphaera sp.]
LRQSDDSLTIKYSRGAVKISKALLPPDVLAKYPIVEPLQPAPLPLPPEPRGLDKTTNGERSVTAPDAVTGLEVRWTCRVAIQGTAGGITRASKNRAGEFKTDFVFPFGVDDVGALDEAIVRARKWAAAVATKKPPSFEKSMGRILGHDWIFSWDGDRIVVRPGTGDGARFEEQDLAEMQTLLRALPHMEKERKDESKAAEDFAATLK